jgi:hypothetical protein
MYNSPETSQAFDDNIIPGSRFPILAFSYWGLANRLLGLSSTMELCRILDRPIALVWESNRHIGHTPFHHLFSNDIVMLDRKPNGIALVDGRAKRAFVASMFPIDEPVQLECNDLFKFPGITEAAIRPHLMKFLLVPPLQERLTAYLQCHDLRNAVGVHICCELF